MKNLVADLGALEVFLIAYAAWNIITFLMFGYDKLKAKMDGWRVSEATLIWCAFVMGGVGAILGSKVFHHKTQKTKFKILLPIALLLNILLLVLTILWFKGII